LKIYIYPIEYFYIAKANYLNGKWERTELVDKCPVCMCEPYFEELSNDSPGIANASFKDAIKE